MSISTRTERQPHERATGIAAGAGERYVRLHPQRDRRKETGMKVVKKVTSSDGTSIALGRAGTGVASSSRRSIGAAGLVAGCSTPSMRSWRALGDADRDDPDRQPAPSFQDGTVSHSPAVVMTYGTLRTRLIVRTAAGHVSSGSALDTPHHPLMTCSFPRGAGRTRTCDRRIMSPPSPAGGFG